MCVGIPLDSNRNEIRWVFDSKGGCMRRKFIEIRYICFCHAFENFEDVVPKKESKEYSRWVNINCG
jgi:hypothetical protein